MDTTSFIIIDMLRRSESVSIYTLTCLLLLGPMISLISEFIKKNLYNISYDNIKFWFFPPKYTLIIESSEASIKGIPQTYYNIPFLAVNYHIKLNNKLNNSKYINPDLHSCGAYYASFTQRSINGESYIMTPIKNFKIDNDIYVTITLSTNSVDNKDTSIKETNHTIKLISYSQNLTDFVDKCCQQYLKSIENKNKNKIFHFVYQETKNPEDNRGEKGKLVFSSSILSDLVDDPNHETFEHIVSVNKKQIMNDIIRLRNKEYYMKHGMKRKKGYLFHGPPGTGKTATVTAMALMDKRHIIEIPMGRVKNDQDFEKF